MKKFLKYVKGIGSANENIHVLIQKIDDLQRAVGRVESRLAIGQNDTKKDIQSYEFKVYSQWGEDGIIQFLVQTIDVKEKIFVEFGVEDYREANTRFLLQNNNWSGLVIDGSLDRIAAIRRDPIYWRYDLKTECAFIDRDNINSIIQRNGIQGDIGLLSVDIDGNDYWVWEAIECIRPAIVLCEYNSLFGPYHAVTIPYEKMFNRKKAHYSMLYAGASITALDRIAKRKGYDLVGSNSAGNNAFFVRKDLLGGLTPKTPAESYVQLQCRDSRDQEGNLNFLRFDESMEAIAGMPLYDVDNDRLIRVRDIMRK